MKLSLKTFHDILTKALKAKDAAIARSQLETAQRTAEEVRGSRGRLRC